MSKPGGPSNAWSSTALKTQCKNQNESIIESGLSLQIAFNPPFPSFLVPTPFTKGRGGGSYLKNRCPHEREFLQGIRDTFESLRNVKVVHIVFTWLQKQPLKGEVFGGKSLDFRKYQ